MGTLAQKDFTQQLMELRIGRWTVVEEHCDHVTVSLAAAYRRGAIIGSAVILLVGAGFIHTYAGQSACSGGVAMLIIGLAVCAIGLIRMLRTFLQTARSPVVLRIYDDSYADAIEQPAIHAQDIAVIKLVDNVLRANDDDDLIQMWAVLVNQEEQLLLYQVYRSDRERIEVLARRLAQRWGKEVAISISKPEET